MAGLALTEWTKGPREAFKLGCEKGVYALFLRTGSRLPGIDVQEGFPLYIGLAAGRRGLLGRCHFEGKTQNHSPRKSLAVLLKSELGLNPVLVRKLNSGDTWGLDRTSEDLLRSWMYKNLDLAVEPCAAPEARETELVEQYAPPLNLNKCHQTRQHRAISLARRAIMTEMLSRPNCSSTPVIDCSAPSGAASAQEKRTESAVAIAKRHGLDPKVYRSRLRKVISWYSKPQIWFFEVDSPEWRDMVSVARAMSDNFQ